MHYKVTYCITADDSRNSEGLYALYLAPEIFRYPEWSEMIRRRPVRSISVAGSYAWQEKNGSDMSPTSTLTLLLSKGPKFGLDFSPQSPLKRFGFETEQHYLKRTWNRSIDVIPKYWLGNSPTPYLILQGSQRVPNLAYHMRYLKRGAPTMTSPHVVQFGLYSTLRANGSLWHLI